MQKTLALTWDGEEYDQIKKMLEKEYSQIDITESVQSLNIE